MVERRPQRLSLKVPFHQLRIFFCYSMSILSQATSLTNKGTYLIPGYTSDFLTKALKLYYLSFSQLHHHNKQEQVRTLLWEPEKPLNLLDIGVGRNFCSKLFMSSFFVRRLFQRPHTVVDSLNEPPLYHCPFRTRSLGITLLLSSVSHP